MAEALNIAVVGAGIVGAALAYHLSERGAAVLLLDGAGPSAGASGTTFACLNAFGHKDIDETTLRIDAIRYQRNLLRSMRAAHLLHLSGTIRFATTIKGAERLARCASVLNAHGFACDFLTKEAAYHLEPDVNFARAIGPIIHVRGEGWTNLVTVVDRLIAAGREKGCLQFMRAGIRRVISGPSSIELDTSEGVIRADRVAVAAGVKTPDLLRELGTSTPVTGVPGVLAISDEKAAVLTHALYADGLHIRPDGDRLMSGTDEPAWKRPGSITPNEIETQRRRIDLEARLSLPRAERGLAPHTQVGVRPVPADGRPIAGWVDAHQRVYAAVMHGGATLGAYVARLAAEEMLSGEVLPQLELLGPQRFSVPAKHFTAPSAPLAVS